MNDADSAHSEAAVHHQPESLPDSQLSTAMTDDGQDSLPMESLGSKEMEVDASSPKRKHDSGESLPVVFFSTRVLFDGTDSSDETDAKKHKTHHAQSGSKNPDTTTANSSAANVKAEDTCPPANVQYRDVVLYGDYGGSLKGLRVDSEQPPESDSKTPSESKWDVPRCVLAVSDGDANEDAPKVRVWAVGTEVKESTKYWELKGSEEHSKKVADGAWLPQIVANELHERMLEEGEESVPVGEFIEEACNESGDSLLVVEASLLQDKSAKFRRTLRAKRGVAQRIIRQFYVKTVRPRSTRSLALTFTQDCTTLDEAVNTPFEDLSSKLREDKVVTAAKDMLHRVIQLANWGRGSKPLISGTVNVKIYLAGYMIAARPNHVFENVADLENKVLLASKPMIEGFHKTAIALSQGKSWNYVRKHISLQLPSLLCTYLRSFKEWKLLDEKKLAGRLTHALRGLEQAERGLKDEEENRKIRTELQAQQKKLREKLAQIAGEKAVQAHDAEQKAERAGGASSSRSVQAATVSRDAAEPQQPAAPAGQVGGMTNEQLAHELLLDKDFRLDEKAGMSDDKLVHTKIRETFERAFWESLVEDLSSVPPTYSRVLSVLTEIKTGIEGLSQGHEEEARIGRVVDMEAITTRLRQNQLGFKGCEELIDEIVKVLLSMHDRMRSPERHKETVDKWEAVRATMQEAEGLDQLARARATCAALELVLDRVHAIRVDTANNKLRAIAPVIREHGVEYEKSHFVKKLDKGTVTLDRTKTWIAHTLSELVDKKDPRVAVQDLAQGKPEDFEVVLYIAMVDLIADYPNWGGVLRGQGDEDVVPETMMLDLLRIKALNMHFHTDVVSSVILVTTEVECREQIQDLAVRAKLFKEVQDIVIKNPPKPNAPRVTIRLVMNALQGHVDQAKLETILDKNVKRSSAVHAAMKKIFKKVWYHLIKDKEVHPSCNVPECARPLLAEVSKHASSLAAVALHNKKVHVTRYNPIIIKAAGKELARNPPAANPAVAANRAASPVVVTPEKAASSSQGAK
mmetsp:Transcript_23312/g.58437  ORF Transcript_23312/g.58437 Transcript_23312/m.58437 type:complete len:1029 (+) Transcript_23312:225-3311(+)|eukprot:CAMPEP_0173443226 /NCGR_PEP_ID=MMETSP1357-20121228/29233_1 /TAXON_ID=77926 /ORGANISM="Hemiselmis rufescens, Strain PCC563" /LENGTH=1028 /DNA_ID=CAMNT_0014409079 /DNA_START=212 /DNA_END=3298 /DNA_ORIENTATION=-